VTKPQQKVMLVTVFDNVGLMHRNFVPVWQSVNYAFHIDVLKCLMDAIQWKSWKNEWTFGSCTIAMYLITHPRSTALLNENQIPTIQRPVISPGPSLCDICFFPNLKIFLSTDKIQQNMTASLRVIATQEVQSYFQQRKDYLSMCVCAQRQYVMGQ